MLLHFWLYAVFFILALWIWKKKQSQHMEPPSYPGALPILGHALFLLGDCVDLFNMVKNFSNFTLKVGGVSKINIVTKPFYFITNPDDLQLVLNTCLDKSFIHDFTKEWIGNGLVTADVVSWKKNRKLFGPAFTQRALHRFLGIFNNQSRRLVDNLAAEVGKGKFDHQSYIVYNMLETVNQTTLGLKNNEEFLIDKNYVAETSSLFEMYIQRFQKFWLKVPFIFNMSNLKKRQDKVINKAKAISYGVINKKKAEFLENNNVPKDFSEVSDKPKTVLDIIFESHMKEDGFTDEETREHLETFVFGSFHTTGSQIVLLLKSVGAHPEVQEEIYKELEQVFGDSDRDVDKDDLSKLTYLEAVIKESIRVYPIIPFIARDTHTDIKLKNYIVPRGTTCVGALYGLNRHPAWGEDAEKFRPQRFLESDRPADCYFAGFSFGRRNCIGIQYALMVMKIILVHIFRRYKVTADDSEMVLKWNAYVSPISGHHIALELRS